MFHDDLMRMEPLHDAYFGTVCTVIPRRVGRFGSSDDPDREEMTIRGIYAMAPTVDEVREGRGERSGLMVAHEKAELAITADQAVLLEYAIRRDDHISVCTQDEKKLLFMVSAVLPDGSGGLQILMDDITREAQA